MAAANENQGAMCNEVMEASIRYPGEVKGNRTDISASKEEEKYQCSTRYSTTAGKELHNVGITLHEQGNHAPHKPEIDNDNDDLLVASCTQEQTSRIWEAATELSQGGSNPGHKYACSQFVCLFLCSLVVVVTVRC